MRHTPAPWEVHDGGRFGQYGDFGPSICHATSKTTCVPLFEIVGPADPKECEANAYLVAAAPKLLAACEAFLNAPCTNEDQKEEADKQAIELALAAIKEARGG